MPYSILLLILLAVALLALLDVILGQRLPGETCGQPVRLGLVEFATKPLPIFLFGVGTAMLPVHPLTGGALLALAGALALAGLGRANPTGGRERGCA